jgi:hypothetical protein
MGGRLGYHANQICLIHTITNRVMKDNSRNLAHYRIGDGTLLHCLCQFRTLKGEMTNYFDAYNEIDYV